MPMNVAIFASAFHPHVGGVEELCRQLAHAYRRRGVRTLILTNRWPRSLCSIEVYEEIPIYRLPLRAPEGSLKARINFQLTHRATKSQMLHILTNHEVDLLHVHCIGLNSYYALHARRALRLPLIATSHGERTMDAGRVYERSRFQNGVLRETLDVADYVTACSEHTLADIKAFYGRPLGRRARVIHNGISLADFESPARYMHSRPFILGIGRLVPQKGFDLLIDAYAAADIRSHDLLIAGDGPEREALARRIGDHGLQDRVHLLGQAGRDRALSLFASCSFVVVPSRQEPYGIVNLEAMAAGKAVIASSVGGVPEVVMADRTGLLVPGESVPDLAKAMARLAEDKVLRARLGAAGRQYAQSSDWSSVAESYLAIYQQVMGSAGLGRPCAIGA